MTDKQPKALRLADALDAVNTNNADSLLVQMAARSAAAELRRLHAENEDFRATIDYLTRENAEQIGEIVALKEQRDELLEALREMVAGDAEAIAEADALGVPFPDEILTSYRRAVAAIAKAGGSTT